MLNGKVVLVTGGTGSFGRKFTEVVLKKYFPKRVIVFSRDEAKQHDMRQAFDGDPRLTFFIGDVRDKDRLYRAFKAEVDFVVHAAAQKQVPACEYNPFEAVKTNIIGAQNIIDAAIDCGVPRVLALSTDKAVGPVNLYGATKLCMEKILVSGNHYAGKRDVRFSCVRYGNVVGSRGSVIPLFIKQRETGEITVTDERMTRFWITLTQGVEFVLRCLSMMKGRELFIPRIPSMGIMDLVKALAPDCKVSSIGIRAGEKLHESLISADEARHTLSLGDMFVSLPDLRPDEIAKVYGEGTPLPEGFVYSSDSNDEWLTVEQLHAMVNEF